MGYIGDWSNLKENLERSKHRMAQLKKRQQKRVAKNSPNSKRTAEFTSLSLVEKRNRLVNKIRWVMLLIVLVLTLLLLYLL